MKAEGEGRQERLRRESWWRCIFEKDLWVECFRSSLPPWDSVIGSVLSYRYRSIKCLEWYACVFTCRDIFISVSARVLGIICKHSLFHQPDKLYCFIDVIVVIKMQPTKPRLCIMLLTNLLSRSYPYYFLHYNIGRML